MDIIICLKYMEHILSWKPTEKQWWITGFNPEHMFNVDVHKQVMIGCVDFSNNEEMYISLKNELLSDRTNKKDFVIFEDSNYKLWIMWYERDAI